MGEGAKYMDYYSVLRRRALSQIARRRNPGSDMTPGERKLLDCIMLLPDLFHLCARLVLDREVPAQNKGPLVAAVIYVMSPIDLIPDIIPALGWADDLLVLALALNRLLQRDSPAIERCISRHWRGSEDLLETVRHILATIEAAARFLPDRFMPVIRGILRKRHL